MGMTIDTQCCCHGCEYYNDGYCRLQKDKEFIDKLTKNIPTWKLVLIDKLTDFKVWFWLKIHKGGRR